MAGSIQIFPAEQAVAVEGVQVTHASVPATLPTGLRTAARVIVTGDNRVLAGMPAEPVDEDGAQIRAAIMALPAVTSALAAYEAEAAEAEAAKQAEALADAIKRECGRRILAVLKDEATQINIMGLAVGLVNKKASGGTLTSEEAADLALADALRGWKGGMLEACRALAAALDMSYAEDRHWPAAPAGAAALVARL